MLPVAGPEPVFQSASKDSRFGFSTTDRDRSSKLSENVYNQDEGLQVITSNPTHSNIHDNGNGYDTDSSDSSDSSAEEDEGEGDGDGDGNGGDDGGDDDDGDGGEGDNGDFYLDNNNNNNDNMSKWLPKSQVINKLMYDAVIHPP
jgi:hypothetical protein